MTSKSTRRAFIGKTGLALGAVAFREATPALVAADGDLPVIDTHTHFYDPTRSQGVPWPPKSDRVLYRKVMPADYRALPKPQPVAGTVVIEASEWLEDNQWILDLAADDAFIVGFVGHLSIQTEDFPKQLERFGKNGLFRGIRVGGEAVQSALAGGVALKNLQLLAERDLSLDLLVGPEMLMDVSRLARRLPRLRMLIDHVANVHIDGKAPDTTWTNGMKAAGGCENLYCKVSGLVEGSGRRESGAPADPDFYRPVLDGIWESFGSERLVYGSNWPVSEIFAPCERVQTIASGYFREKGGEAWNKCFHLNSKAFYKWRERNPGQKP
jgi:L-fuconolactonase